MRTGIRLGVVAITFILTVSCLSYGGFIDPSRSVMALPEYDQSWHDSSYYVNDDIVNIWMGANLSAPLYPYPYANEPPATAANFFRTQSFTPLYADYDELNVSDDGYWGGSGSEFYFGIDPVQGVSLCTKIADQAVIDHRIKGAMWDDFAAGTIDPEDMEDVYDALHHEDTSLPEPLKLILVCYNKDYYKQTPYTWAEIHDYYDVISFWYYPHNYGTLWCDWWGYTDAFFDMRTLTGGDKEYWLGYYLHFYDLGNYPWAMSYQQAGIYLGLIKGGYADRLHVLGGFWVRNSPETSNVLKNFIEEEYWPDYYTNLNSTAVVTRTGGSTGEIVDDAIRDIEGETAFCSDGIRFYSDHFQTVQVSMPGWEHPNVVETDTGRYLADTSLGMTGVFTFQAMPHTSYRIFDKEYTATSINAPLEISTAVSWQDKVVTVNSWVNVVSGGILTIQDSRVRFGTPHYEHSSGNCTDPNYGIATDTGGKLIIRDSVLEPVQRQFTYFLNITDGTVSGKKQVLENATLAHFTDRWEPQYYFYMNDSVMFCPVGNGETTIGFWFIQPARVAELRISRSAMLNQDMNGFTTFWMPSGLEALTFRDNRILGGNPSFFYDGSGHPAGPYHDRFYNITVGHYLDDGTACFVTPLLHDYVRYQLEGWSGSAANAYFYHEVNIYSEVGFTGKLKDRDGDTITDLDIAAGGTQTVEAQEVVYYYPSNAITYYNPLPWSISVETMDGYGLTAWTEGTGSGLGTIYWGIHPWQQVNDSEAVFSIYTTDMRFLGLAGIPSGSSWIDTQGIVGFPDGNITKDHTVAEITSIWVQADQDLSITDVVQNSGYMNMTVNATAGTTLTVNISGLDDDTAWQLSVNGHIKRMRMVPADGCLVHTETLDGETSFSWVEGDFFGDTINLILPLIMLCVFMGIVSSLLMVRSRR